MPRQSFKYKEFVSFEAYNSTPFTEMTGMGTAFMKPDEELLRPVYGKDSMPKKVKDLETGMDLQGGIKYHGKSSVLDRRQYAKVFIDFIDIVIGEGLSLPGLRMLFFIMKRLQPGKDIVRFSIKTARQQTGYKADKSVYEGLVDLLKLGVIARVEGSVESYFVNPEHLFRGNRLKINGKK